MDKQLISAEVKVLESDNPNGEFLVTLSTPSLDRDGEILDAGCFNPLPDHIPFDIDHGLSTASTVGSGRPFYDGDRLMVQGTFASTPLGQQVRSLVTEGHIRTTSVAMRRPQKETKDGVPHITKAELLNGAFVPVPANRDALVVSSKAGARHNAADKEAIAGIYAHLEALGFTCPNCAANTAAADDTEKSVDGEDATGADRKTAESTREDTSGAGGDDEQQQIELRAHALRLIAGSVT